MKSAVMLLAVLSAQNGGSGEAAAARLRKLYLERWGTTDCKSIQEQNGRRGCDEVIAMTAMMVEKMIEHWS